MRVRRTPLLTQQQKDNRLWFAKNERRTDWRTWIWTDEKWFCCGGVQGNERMWVSCEDRHPNERYVPKLQAPTKVMVWGAVSYITVVAAFIFTMVG